MNPHTAQDRILRRPSLLRQKKVLTTLLAAGTLVTGAAVLVPSVASAAPVRVAASGHLLAAPGTGPTSVGQLKPQGCSGSPGTVGCDLYAKPGTVQAGGVNLPIWGFSTDPTGNATAPGPLLVVTQSDVVTVTLHNTLGVIGATAANPGRTSPMSLAFPGQHLVNGGGGDDRTGVDNGGSRTYTFTADHAGTFVYEAGHTPDGARQVAMGLAGALVVMPSTPDSSYQDDAPLVLSEIDPALNTSADPLSWDMRTYKPAYRLINGQAFSQTNPVATDQGNTVKLRYVNVGQQMHAMSVLGGSQVEVAQDGNPMAYSTTVTAESVDPGTTLDTLVTMPGTKGVAPSAKTATKVTIYEANGGLDNNAQVGAVVTGQPTQVAFGGMMIYLDTQASVDTSSDKTGPTAKALTVSPNPSDALAAVTVTATVDDSTSGNSAITAAEYVIDDDNASGPVAPGFGVAMAVPTGAGPTTTVSGIIPASVLADPSFAAGKHIVYVRGVDAQNNWGVVGSVVLNVPKTGPATTNGSATPALTNGSVPIDVSATGDDSTAGGNVTAAEYFIDTPGTAGNGTAMTLNRTATVVSVDATVSAAKAATLSEGVHHFWVHVKDNLGSGLWGPLLDLPVTIDKTGPATLATAMSPPATNGVTSDPSNPGYLKVTTEIQDGGLSPSNIVQAEAFLGTVKATGSGLQLRPIDGKLDTADESMYALIPLSQYSVFKTDQNVQLYVHGKDAAGNWGSTATSVGQVILDRTAPVLSGSVTSALMAPGTPGIALTASLTEKNTILGGEYWTTQNDPGVGKATSTQASVANGAVTVNVPFTTAVTTYHFRVKDIAGNWSNALQATVSPFRSNLETTTSPFGWSAVGGSGASVVTAAAQSNPDENPSHNGLLSKVALSPNGSRTGYLVDNTPVKASAYHARFQFQAPTLSSGTNANNWVTVFDTRTANGANNGSEVFAIQYKGTGSTGQIRSVVGGTAGVAKTVAITNHTIQVDWTNGAAAKLVFSVDGTTQYTVSAANVTTTIEAAQLGISNTTVATTNSVGPVGNAWFDTFLSVGS